MDKITKQFSYKEKLKYGDMNSIVNKTNELVDAADDLASKISNIGIAYVDEDNEAIVYDGRTLVFAE